MLLCMEEKLKLERNSIGENSKVRKLATNVHRLHVSSDGLFLVFRMQVSTKRSESMVFITNNSQTNHKEITNAFVIQLSDNRDKNSRFSGTPGHALHM